MSTTEAGHTPKHVYCHDMLGLVFSNGNSFPWPECAPEADWDYMKAALVSHTRLESEVEALREALQDLDAAFVLFLHERNLTVRADETIVRDAIKRACDLLAQTAPKPAQGTEGKL